MSDYDESEDQVKKSIYRKVEAKTWGDEKFLELTPMPPSGQGLWLFLLTGPMLGPIPGLFRSGRSAMAEDLNWSVEDFDKHFQEVLDQGMVRADFKAKLVWVQKAIEHNKPASPNVVRSWSSYWHNLPECTLKLEAYEALKAHVCGLGEGYAKAFKEAIKEPSMKALRKAMPNQEQEQEQKHDLEQKQKIKEMPSADAPATGGDLFKEDGPANASGNPAGKSPATMTETVSKSGPVWNSYREAYIRRYQCEPVRSAKENSQLCKFIDRVGADIAPDLAAFYLTLNTEFYVRRAHAVDLLVSDYQAIHTQYSTGRRITSTGSKIADRTSANADAISQAKQMARRQH